MKDRFDKKGSYFALRLQASCPEFVSLWLHAELPLNPGEVPYHHTHFHIPPNSLPTIILPPDNIYQ